MKNYKVNSTVYIWYETKDATPAGIAPTANGTVVIKKNDSTTERTSLNGVTHTISHDGDVGQNLIKIDLSDNTDAGFYAANSHIQVGIRSQTVDGVTDSPIIEEFGIELLTFSDVTHILGTLLTETLAGRIAGGVKKFFDVATPASTMELLTAVATLNNAPPDSAGVGTLLTRLSAARATYLDLLSSYLDAAISTLTSRLTATRAGYLDNLSGGAVALASVVGTLLTKTQFQDYKKASVTAYVASSDPDGAGGASGFARTIELGTTPNKITLTFTYSGAQVLSVAYAIS